MINRDKIERRIASLHKEIAANHLRSAAARANGQDWLSEMSDLDAHYLEEELCDLERKMASIAARKTEIVAFEDVTGEAWDAWSWELPSEGGSLIAWWLEIDDTTDESQRTLSADRRLRVMQRLAGVAEILCAGVV